MDYNSNYQSSSNVLAALALVCGLLGIIGSFISILMFVAVISLVLSILGVIFGAVGLKKSSVCGSGKGLATAGLVLGIVGIVFSAIGLSCSACLYTAGIGTGFSDIPDIGSLFDEIGELIM